jgi:hypothetical protein
MLANLVSIGSIALIGWIVAYQNPPPDHRYFVLVVALGSVISPSILTLEAIASGLMRIERWAPTGVVGIIGEGIGGTLK